MKRLVTCLYMLCISAFFISAMAQEVVDSTSEDGPLVVYSDTTDSDTGSEVIEENITMPNRLNQDLNDHSISLSAPEFIGEMLSQWLPSWLPWTWIKRIFGLLVVGGVYLLVRKKQKNKEEQ